MFSKNMDRKRNVLQTCLLNLGSLLLSGVSEDNETLFGIDGNSEEIIFSYTFVVDKEAFLYFFNVQIAAKVSFNVELLNKKLN